MEITREKLQSTIRSMTEDELAVLMAILQIKIHDLGSNAVRPVPPDGMSKAGCKRLIKSIRTKTAGICETRAECDQVISHIRNVWIPQIKSHDQQAG